MRRIQSGVRAVMLILTCVLLLSLLLNIGNGLVLQAPQTANINQNSFSSGATGRVHQNPLADIYIQQSFFYQDTQQILRLKNKSCMEVFYSSADGLFYPTVAKFISLSDQIPDFKVNYFLIAPNSPNAPPAIPA